MNCRAVLRSALGSVDVDVDLALRFGIVVVFRCCHPPCSHNMFQPNRPLIELLKLRSRVISRLPPWEYLRARSRADSHKHTHKRKHTLEPAGVKCAHPQCSRRAICGNFGCAPTTDDDSRWLIRGCSAGKFESHSLDGEEDQTETVWAQSWASQ